MKPDGTYYSTTKTKMNVYDEIKQIIRQPKTRQRYGEIDTEKLISLLDTWDNSAPGIETTSMLDEIKKKARSRPAVTRNKTRYMIGLAAAAVDDSGRCHIPANRSTRG